MTINKIVAIAAATATLPGGAAMAGCGLEGGSVRILGNDFGAIHAVAERAGECAGDGVTVTSNLTTEFREIQVPALTTDPAQYTTAIVASSSIVPLLNADLVRPLDDLVAEHGQSLSDGQLIRVGGKIVAVAFMANAQHLYYRKDILAEHGIEPPQSYEDVIAAAQRLKEAGAMPNPFVANTKTGWDLGEEFVNMYLGYGGEFFKPGTAEVTINNDHGVAALNTLKALSEVSNPDFLTYDSNSSGQAWETGKAALGVMWGSRGSALLDDQGSTPEIVENTVLAAAPTVGGGEVPASSLWWDGFVVAKNIPDEDAIATFVAMTHAISPDMLKDHNADAVWLIDGYQPTPAAAGVSATVAAKARPYPMVPYMGLLHVAIGDGISDFLQGRESAEQALADIEATYATAAREQGFLN